MDHIILFNFVLFLILGCASIAVLYITYRVTKVPILFTSLMMFIAIYINALVIVADYYIMNTSSTTFPVAKTIVLIFDSVIQFVFIFFLFNLIEQLFAFESLLFNRIKYIFSFLLLIVLFAIAAISNHGNALLSFVTSCIYLLAVPFGSYLIVKRKKTVLQTRYQSMIMFYSLFFIVFNINNFLYWIFYYNDIPTTGINIICSSCLLVLAASILVYGVRFIPKIITSGNTPTKARLTPFFCDKYRITAREKDIIDLIVDAKSNKEISKQLGIKETTVKVIIYNIFQKVKVKNRLELINTLFQYEIDHG